VEQLAAQIEALENVLSLQERQVASFQPLTKSTLTNKPIPADPASGTVTVNPKILFVVW
jgi:hypothetical protein